MVLIVEKGKKLDLHILLFTSESRLLSLDKSICFFACLLPPMD